MVPKTDESPDVYQNLGHKSKVCAVCIQTCRWYHWQKYVTRYFCLLQMRIYLLSFCHLHWQGHSNISYLQSFHSRHGCLLSPFIFKYVPSICLLTAFPLEDWNKANWNKWTGEKIRLHYIDCVGFLIAACWGKVPDLIGRVETKLSQRIADHLNLTHWKFMQSNSMVLW